ncbi:D-alanyl-D-alanine carboxypeptidase/D-alanyl-D-alanine endopeptidase [Austwickia chelonae]|uniref:D-alanyl-D-alanine carboxypeptidase/D-alanyl-D-alanine endopeptidase n=1 Tax=Austwickia chelonae TaxID=100225 RepID=UPI000E22471F|nr:D-alanyl-D-alanine carboxypeptidase/D-alanyl-D-alanine-endopeptidase [Austwickia chelonae]
MRKIPVIAAGITLTLCTYVCLDAADIVPGVFTTEASVTVLDGAPAPQHSGAEQSGGKRWKTADRASALPTLDRNAPLPTPETLAKIMAPLTVDRALGSETSAVVLDGITGKVLYDVGGRTPRTPASVTKLLSAAAIGSAVSLNQTLETKVVRGVRPQEIVLVAGGDTLLASENGNPASVLGYAGLGELAQQVADRLKAAKVPGPVQLTLDDGRYRGPAVDPAWDPQDIVQGYVGPVTPLGMAVDLPAEGRPAPADPSMNAAAAFRAALTRRGIAVAEPVTRGAAPGDAQTLGSVRSASLGDQLGYALAASDNMLTAALTRIAAVQTGNDPAFPSVASWVTGRIAALNVPVDGMKIVDASGLAPGTTVTAQTVAAVLHHAASEKEPRISQAFSGLPVGGLTGTLATRYLDGPQRAGAGMVRAKTGTLTGVSSLAGNVVDQDGRLLVFAIIADRLPAGVHVARPALDRFAAALAACGCR